MLHYAVLSARQCVLAPPFSSAQPASLAPSLYVATGSPARMRSG